MTEPMFTYQCASCGDPAAAVPLEEAELLHSGCVLVCPECGGDTVFDLWEPKQRAEFYGRIEQAGQERDEARAMLEKAYVFLVGEMRHSEGRAVEDVFVEAREIGDEPRWIVRHGMNRLDPSGEWYIRLDYEDIAYASWSTLEEAWAAAEAAIAAGESEPCIT